MAPRRSLLRVFIDSSVLIAAAISTTGSAHDLIRLGLDGAISLLVSSLVLQETERNLTRKAPQALALYTGEFRPALLSRVTDPPQALVERVAQTIAAKDAPVVAAALTARTDYLASYDRKHLLSQAARIQAAYGLIVTTPDQILTNR